MVERVTFHRPSLPHDYFRDDKDRICQVLTWHHPKDRRLCLVKYDLGNGFWVSRETGLQYKRILKSYSLEGQQNNLQYIQTIEPEYLHISKVYGVMFLAIPTQRIKQYYYPEKRLIEIMSEKENDVIEQKVKAIATLLYDNMKIPIEDIGIAGSILWKGQTKKSDIDLIIYGNNNAQDFNDKFPLLYDLCSNIIPMPDDKTKRYVESMSRKSGLSTTLAKKYIAKKKWLAVFEGTHLSVMFNPKSDELPFKYGDEIYKPLVPISIECSIINSDFGYTYPSMYDVGDYEFLSNPPKEFDFQIKRILSFEGALTGYFKRGDRVIVRGLLEKVSSIKKKLSFGQILLGTKECRGNEFIILKEDFEDNIKCK